MQRSFAGSSSIESTVAKAHNGVASRLLQSALRVGFRKAYPHLEVNPEKYLVDARRTYGLPIETWGDAHRLGEDILHPVAERIIRSSARLAAIEGLGFGLAGIATIVPDMGALAAITLRMLQKLSLVHGFEYSTGKEVAALWFAAATAAGLDFTREYLQKQAIEHAVPRLIDAMAVKIGAEVAEKWVGRAVPLLSAGAAAGLNYHFVRTWGRRAQEHFLERYRAARAEVLNEQALPDPASVC